MWRRTRLLADAYREARLTVLPSEYRGVRAGAARIPRPGDPGRRVPRRRHPGVRGGRARLASCVPPGDVPAFSEAIATALGGPKPSPARSARYGRDQVVPRYTWDRARRPTGPALPGGPARVKIAQVTAAVRRAREGSRRTSARSPGACGATGEEVDVYASDLYDEATLGAPGGLRARSWTGYRCAGFPSESDSSPGSRCR